MQKQIDLYYMIRNLATLWIQAEYRLTSPHCLNRETK